MPSDRFLRYSKWLDIFRTSLVLYITYTDDRELLTEYSTFNRYRYLQTAISVSPGWNITHVTCNDPCALLQNYYFLLDPQQLGVIYDIISSVAAVGFSLVTFQDLPNGKSISHFTDDFKRYESINSISIFSYTKGETLEIDTFFRLHVNNNFVTAKRFLQKVFMLVNYRRNRLYI
jgi:hypothetical protein